MKMFVFAFGSDYDYQEAVVLAESGEEARKLLVTELRRQEKDNLRSSGRHNVFHTEENLIRAERAQNYGFTSYSGSVVFTYGRTD